MSAAVILYGSRARGSGNVNSDVDILFSDSNGNIGTPREVNGVSMHQYPQKWLLNEAESGNLFVYHVGFEGVPLFDPDKFIDVLKSAFQFKDSYVDDVHLANGIMDFVLFKPWGSRDCLRRRYFWSIRTIIIASMAEARSPSFSAHELEAFSGVPGLESHIQHRHSATYEDCRRFGSMVADRFGLSGATGKHELLRAWLLSRGGIGEDTVRLLETHEAIEFGSMPHYQ